MASPGVARSARSRGLRTRRKKAHAQRRLNCLKKQAARQGALFELWYADGVRFDLLPSVRSAWRRRGQCLALPTPGKNVRVGVVGAVRYPTGDFRFAHPLRSVTSALFLALLPGLVARAKRTGRRIVLVLDNGGAFTSRASTAAIEAAKPHVRLFWLPRYTSETLSGGAEEGRWQVPPHLTQTNTSKSNVLVSNSADELQHVVMVCPGRPHMRRAEDPARFEV